MSSFEWGGIEPHEPSFPACWVYYQTFKHKEKFCINFYKGTLSANVKDFKRNKIRPIFTFKYEFESKL